MQIKNVTKLKYHVTLYLKMRNGTSLYILAHHGLSGNAAEQCKNPARAPGGSEFVTRRPAGL